MSTTLTERKLESVDLFIENRITFEPTQKEPLKKIYQVYTKSCETCVPLGKLKFQQFFRERIKEKCHYCDSLKTPQGVVFEGLKVIQNDEIKKKA